MAKRPFWQDIIDTEGQKPFLDKLVPLTEDMPIGISIEFGERLDQYVELSTDYGLSQVEMREVINSVFQNPANQLVHENFEKYLITSVFYHIKQKLKQKENSLTINQLIISIEDFVEQNPRHEAASAFKDILAKIGKPKQENLPTKAPELYKGRPSDSKETAPAFFNRVYKDYIGKGLTRPVLSRLDPSLVRRIDYLRNDKADPEALALDLPTAWVGPQKWADRVLAGEETVPIVADAKTHRRNTQRLASAHERADRKSRKISER